PPSGGGATATRQPAGPPSSQSPAWQGGSDDRALARQGSWLISSQLALSSPPLPQPGHYARWQPAIQLPGHHDNLAAMMRVVGDEVAEDVPHVQLQVAPHVRLRGRNAATLTTPQLKESGNPPTAPFQGYAELRASNTAVINPRRGDDPMLTAQGLDPPAPRVVQVGGNGSDRPTGHVRHSRGPEGGRDLLDEVVGDAATGVPCAEDGVLEIGKRRRGHPLVPLDQFR